MNYTDVRPNAPIRSFLLDTREDIEQLPTQNTTGTFGKTVPTGSSAFVTEDSSVWVLNNAGTWAEV